MAEPTDMIMPTLREMRAEIAARDEKTQVQLGAIDRRLGAIEAAQASFKQALGADSLLSKLVTGEFQERIEALENRVHDLESRA